jgi:2-polyprenyl-3-methyl-5-hydroxy-6-metoxy-1,4-benzoquinol methylase
MKEFWNERYGKSMYHYGKAPNVFFAKQLGQIPKGKILLPSEGEGRNAVYAAIKGWEVKAFDYSEEGRKKALALAENYDVELDYELIEASKFKSKETYDVVAMIFAHFAGEERIELCKKLELLLAPGGYLIMEVFSKNQLGRESGGPKDLDLLYSKDEVKAMFPNLDFIILEEAKVELDEGATHQGDAAVIRALAQKRE